MIPHRTQAMDAVGELQACEIVRAAPALHTAHGWKHWCETCEGLGTIDERLGGEFFSNPKAECPDCDGKGYWIPRAAPASLTVEQAWQPIELAPKDGTQVLLFGLWAGEIHGISETPTFDIGAWHGGGSDFGPEWWDLSTGDAYACWMKPTHFMRIPHPPSPVVIAALVSEKTL